MAKYKILVSIDESNFFWVVNDWGRLIWNATAEDLEDAIIPKSYNKTNICPRCREEGNITNNSILYTGNAYRDTNRYGKKIDEWVCKMHALRHYNRFYPNSTANLKKQLGGRRTGNLNPKSNQAIGDKCEEVTHIWLGVEKLSSKYDNYRLSFDHSPIPEGISIIIGDKLVDLSGKLPQTKGGRYIPKYGVWEANSYIEHGKKFDILILYCLDEDGKNIERIYILPRCEIMNIKNITIPKNPPIGTKYEKYRVKDEEIIKNVNDVLKKIINTRHN